MVHLYAWVVPPGDAEARRLVVSVIDHGRWAAHHPDGHQRRWRGFGLRVMAAATSALHVQPGPGGTTVILSTNAGPHDHTP